MDLSASERGPRQRLDAYRLPNSYGPGAGLIPQLLWFCLASPLLAARWLPGSGWRVSCLRLFGAQIGRGCRLKPGLRVKYPWLLVVGEHCWLAEDLWIDNLACVSIGSQACLSQGAYLCTGNHDYRRPSFDLIAAPIHIGSGAWIGAMARLGPGVTIGADAVVALGAVVTRDVPPAVVVRGNPAAVIRRRWVSE